MKIDRELATAMEAAMVARSTTGPNANPPVEERKVPRASSLCHGCARKEWYYLTGAPEEPMTPAGASATTMGQAIEADVLADLEASLPGEWRQQVKVEAPWFKGTADAVLFDGVPCPDCEGKGHFTAYDQRGDNPEDFDCGNCDGGRYVAGEKTLIVADSKSANVASWEIKERQGSCGEEIEAQLQLYMHATGAPEAIAVFRKTGGNAKDMGRGVYLPIRFPYRPEVVERLEKVALEAMAARVSGVAPPPGLPKGHWLCGSERSPGYCPYARACPNGVAR